MSKRYLLCGGDFCTLNIGLMSHPCYIMNEFGCCNVKGKSGYGSRTTGPAVAKAIGKRLDGQLVIVTGGSFGIGREAARSFYELGATVVITSRAQARADEAKAWIESNCESKDRLGALVPCELDLGSFKSTEAFAQLMLARPEPLYCLVNNAALMATPFKLTEDGWETQYQVNYLGHFYLTLMLLERLEAVGPSRVVHVSSISQVHAPAHGCYAIPCCVMCLGDFDDKRWPAKSGGCCAYDPMEDYSFSKLAQLVFSNELDRRVKERGDKLITTTVDPGLSKHTNISKSSCCFNCIFNYSPMPLLMHPMLKSVPQQAGSILYAALSDDVKGGDLVMNSNVLPPSAMNRYATTPRYGPPLWDQSVANLGALGAQLPSVAPAAVGMERTGARKSAVAPSDAPSAEVAQSG